MKNNTQTLINTLRILAGNVKSAEVAEAADRLEELSAQLKEAQDYADRLVAHKDMVCLPADLENLRRANSHFATENHILREQLRSK